MRVHHPRLMILGVCLSGLVAEVTTQQTTVPNTPVADGLVRSELSLAGKTVSLAFAPDLKADDPAYRRLLTEATASAEPSRVPVGQLQTNGSLRIGTLTLGKDDPAGLRYDLWLESTRDGWQLQAANAASGGPADAAPIAGQVVLPRRAAAIAWPTFAAALTPSTGDTARLVLRWGAYEATSDVQFTDPPRRARQTENTRANVTTNRTHDEDTSALSRARLLAQRNETAVTLPKGPRLSVSFARFFSRQERAAAGTSAAINTGLGVDGPDFARLMSTADGAVVQLTESAVPRLRIEAPLRFGKITVPVGNQGRGFPGSYGVWLKRVAGGWRLVLNHEADAWGSQHDPKFDAVEIPLTHSQVDAAPRPFAVALAPTAADRGRLVIIWGPHEWSADFVVAI